MDLFQSLLKTVFVSTIALIFTSCKGQVQNGDQHPVLNVASPDNADTIPGAHGDLDCIIEDLHGNYWIGSNGHGVYHYDGTSLKQITTQQGLCSDFIFKIQMDAHGFLWFSTRDGICRYDGKTFSDYTDSITNAPYFGFNPSERGLFFGHRQGICFYNGTSFRNFSIQPSDFHPLPGDNNLPYSIYSSLIDKTGNAWFGTQSKGVCRRQGNTSTFLTDKNLAGPAVRAMVEDPQGILWFGNNGGGLYRYDGQTLTNITEEKALGNPKFLAGIYHDLPGSMARIFALNTDNEGNLLIGTIDAGLWKYDGIHLTNYTTTEGLSGNSIRDIYKNKGGEIFIVSNSNAITKYDGKTFTELDFHGEVH